jgi:hypothetical protein
MAWSAPQFRNGLNLTDKGLANEGGWEDMDKMRVWQGRHQVLGGWQLHTPTPYDGTARGSHSWRTLEGKPTLAFGTESNLWVEIEGIQRDVTPDLLNEPRSDIFTTTLGSNIVGVNIPFHRMRTGDDVTFANHQAAVGGLTIEGTFAVKDVESPDKFTIEVGSNASTSVTTPGGGYVDVLLPLPIGLPNVPQGGYGANGYSEGPYGTAPENTVTIRDWSLGNWGEFLLANPSGYGIFEFQPEIAYPDLAYNGSFTGNADGWALGTGWAYASDAVTATAGTGSNLSQNVEGVLEGGRVYVATFTVTHTAGQLKLRMNAGATPAVIDIGPASAPITKSGTYTRIFLCPATPKDIVFEKDSTFAGSIDNVSYKLMDRAYRITTAPPRVDYMFVDPKGLVIALGTTLIDGTYSATAVRTSDLGNNRAWVPDTNSMATEMVLSGVGGRMMAGLSTRQQNLVWSDQRVLSLQWAGQAGQAFVANDLGGSCGLISRHAMCEHNGFVSWMTNSRQFRIFRGIGATSLGVPEILVCPLQADIFDNLDYRQAPKIHAGFNPEFSEIWFWTPDMRDRPDEQTPSECSRAWVVSYAEGDDASGVPWVKHKMARTSWQPTGVFPNPIGFGTDHRIYEHEQGHTANGQPLGEFLLSAPVDAGEGEGMLAISRIIPHFSDQAGDLDFEFICRNSPNGPERVAGPYRSTPQTETIPTRIMARQIAVRISGATAGGFWRMGATRFDMAGTQVAR